MFLTCLDGATLHKSLIASIYKMHLCKMYIIIITLFQFGKQNDVKAANEMIACSF